MSFSRFLKDKTASVVTYIIMVLVVAGVLFFTGSDLIVMAIVCGVLSLGGIVIFCTEYGKKRRFYKGLLDEGNRSDEGISIYKETPQPKFFEEEVLVEAIRLIEANALSERQKTQNFAKLHRNFVSKAESAAIARTQKIRTLLAQNPIDTKEIEFEIDEILNLIDKTLYFPQSSEIGGIPTEPCRLREVVMEQTSRCSHQLFEKRVGVGVKGLEHIVDTNPEILGFIVRQLLMNSVAFRDEKSAVKITAKKDENAVTLIVQDNCKGFAKGDISHVGEYGFSRNGELGVGLFLCKRLCDELGIEFNITSAEGEGTTVSLTFPTNKSEEI